MLPVPINHKKASLRNEDSSRIHVGHEMVILLADPSVGLHAYIAIHNTNLGPALGGTRLLKYDSSDDALADSLRLSKAMSYKCALANLPYGGGKGVVMYDSGSNLKDVLRVYAERVEKLRGLFKTGTDVGLGDSDVAYMGKFTKHMLGLTPGDRKGLSTSDCAAMGVYSAIKATMEFLEGSQSVRGKKYAIKGVGKLGSTLTKLISDNGGIVFIADVEKEKCEKLAQLDNVHIVAVDEVHKLDVDIYSPCALGKEFNVDTITELQCKAIVGGANNQLANSNADKLIDQRNIQYVPDYIANAGGLIYVADELEAGGFKPGRVRSRIDGIQTTVYKILERSKKEDRTTTSVADSMAEEIISTKGNN